MDILDKLCELRAKVSPLPWSLEHSGYFVSSSDYSPAEWDWIVCAEGRSGIEGQSADQAIEDIYGENVLTNNAFIVELANSFDCLERRLALAEEALELGRFLAVMTLNDFGNKLSRHSAIENFKNKFEEWQKARKGES